MLSAVPLRVWLYLGGALIAGACVWVVLGWKHDAERLPQVQRELAAVRSDYAKVNEAIAKQEKRLQESRKATELLSESLKHETDKNPVYRTCIVPAEWMRLRNQLVAAAAR